MMISLDPGLNGTGWALWDDTLFPRECGVWNGKGEWLENTNRMCDLLQARLTVGVDKVYCEFPAYFNDAGGQMCAATGALLKLTCLVGAFSRVCAVELVEFYPVPVKNWKGDLSKEAVIKRLHRKLPGIESLKPKSHAYDAIGIGLYAKGGFP